MDKQTSILVIAGACLLVIFMGAIKNKAEFLLNFCLRSVMGGLAVYGINLLLESWGIPCSVGINLCSLLTSGTLGFCGVILLYAVAAFPLL